MKICNKCKIEKDESEFYRDKSHGDGLNSWCKNCVRAVNALPEVRSRKKIYDASPEVKASKKLYRSSHEGREVGRKKDLKRKYGITFEQY